MSFELDEFIASPTLEVLDTAKKDDLLKIAQHYNISSVKQSLRKKVIRDTIIKYLVHEGVFPDSALETIQPEDPGFETLQLRELELKYQLEMQRLESEKEERLERQKLEQEERLQKLELEKQRLETEERMKKLESEERMNKERMALEMKKELELQELKIRSKDHSPSRFDATKHIRLVPRFAEKEVDKYFMHFEKIAKSLKWPKEVWTLLLQSALIGKARDTFTSLSIEQSSNYDLVKKAILKAYELVPEAYRQKFRSSEKTPEQTHVEFARDKEQLFDRWLASKQVDKNFDQLKQLILIEEFKNCIRSDIRTHLDEQKVETLNAAAVMADDYFLTHKTNFVPSNTSKMNKDFRPFSKSGQNKSQHESGINRPKVKADQNDSSTSKGSGRTENKPPRYNSFVPSCTYCNKRGHIISQCFVRERDEARSKDEARGQKSSPNACAAVQTENCKSWVQTQTSETHLKKYEPYITKGYVSMHENDSNAKPVRILRDTGASQTLMLSGILPLTDETSTHSSVLIKGVDGIINVPLHKVHLKSDMVSGPVTVGIRPTLPIEGISILLGNDLANDKLVSDPIVTDRVFVTKTLEESSPIFPACVVTRAMQKRMNEKNRQENHSLPDPGTDSTVSLADTIFQPLFENTCSAKTSDVSESADKKPKQTIQPGKSLGIEISDSPVQNVAVDYSHDSFDRNRLIAEQMKDSSLADIRQRVLSKSEVEKVPVCFFMKDDVLMRKWRPPDVTANSDWCIRYQVVVPTIYREEVMSMAHDTPMSGHLGVRKTYDRISAHFFWPRMKQDIAEYCRTCHTCQVVGKPNQKIPQAPLQPIPAFEEPFNRVLIDCVGPLPKTKCGNEYLLTIMCTSTRFPEAIPLRNIKAKTIVKALIKFFTLVGLPKSIQSDQGTNFMSHLFQQVMFELGIKQYKSSAYHPESQGALERFHQTLKNMLRTYCLEYQKDWDEGVHLVLFAAREGVQESLGFSPFELVFGHSVRGPLKLLKEKWLGDSPGMNLLDYVSNFKQKLKDACQLARNNLEKSQATMKKWYDKDARRRSFNVGDKVLVLLPVTGHALQARYHGPYVIESKVSDLDYVVKTPDRRRERQLCHINMIKEYIERDNIEPVMVNTVKLESDEDQSPPDTDKVDSCCTAKLNNSDVLANLDKKLEHLSQPQRSEVKDLIMEFSHLFPDVPSRTDIIKHDVDIGESTPIKQHPYRVNPEKRKHMDKEVQYMLENDIIERSNSPWSSPCVLVPKPDQSYRFCTDFRKVNNVTKTDSYPIPRIDDCIDKIGQAKYVSKFDLLKGYWQIPLTDRAKEVSAFVTPDAFYQYKVMPFGMKNAPATFQRMVNGLVSDLKNTEGYIDDIVTYSNKWQQHLTYLRNLFIRLSEAKLTVNLLKSEFCQAVVQYLGHRVGQGIVRPIAAKVEAINNFPVPTSRRELMRFLGMAGYYRKFCSNFSTLALPLTNLLQKKVKFIWSDACQIAFEKIKTILMSEPILAAPDFSKPFQLMVDASDIGVGSILLQADETGVAHPVCYYSKKLNKHQKNYSTIEKECLALLSSLQHFEVYLKGGSFPVTVFTDHNPITFISRMKGKNQRLLRWSLTLAEYNLDIRHIRGRDNVIADALSRAGS